MLSDGGVYDNLGLETAWKRYRTILVSDGGGQIDAAAEPHARLARSRRSACSDVIDNQVRALRKRQVIGGYETGDRATAPSGASAADVADYRLADAAAVPAGSHAPRSPPCRRGSRRWTTRVQERLINWGYAICDAAMRAHVVGTGAPPAAFPYPGRVL